MIGAGDGPAQLLRRVDKDHPAMPADILEHVDPAFARAHQQQRRAQKRYRLYHTGLGNILAVPYGRPVVPKQCVLFMLIHIVTDIAGVRKPVCRFNRRENVAQV